MVNKTAIERSVSHLQTIISVIIGLSLIESIRIIVGFKTDPISIEVKIEYLLSTFVSFLFTLIPFHHGASRYLDEKYIMQQSPLPPLSGLVDYLFFFIEACVFYILALTITQPRYFLLILTFVFAIDIIWLLSVKIIAPVSFIKIKSWILLNFAMVFILVIFDLNIITLNNSTLYILTGLVVVRTILDYWLSWNFYWPISNRHK